jgi:hypothetical protein
VTPCSILVPVTKLGALLLWVAPALPGQWFNYPTPNLPRTPDGKVDLSAPVPRTADGHPDLSALWQPANGGADPQFRDIAINVPGGLPFQPWAAELVKARRADENKDDPDGFCKPLGLVKMHLHPYPRKLIQLPGLLILLFERETTYRQIFTDGRPLPVDPNPAFMGYSVGHWEDDTLVVETIGLVDGLWLDISGTPLTDAARLTERYRRPKFGELEIEVTIDDPKAYTRPWSIKIPQTLAADTEMLEFYCNQNEKDVPHLVGK